MCSLGLINYVKVKDGGSNVFDMIPVDTVSNGILITTAHAGQKPGNELDIYNCGTGDVHPIHIHEFRTIATAANKYFAFDKKAFPMSTNLITNETEYKVKKHLFNTLPV